MNNKPSKFSNKKRIVVIQAYEFFPDFRVHRELELLKQTNAELHVIIWQRTENGKFISSYPGVQLHKVLLPALYGMGASAHLKLQPKFFKRAYALLKLIRPDLIVAQNFEAMLPSALYRLRKFVPVLYVSREPYHKVFRIKTGSMIGEIVGWFGDAVLAHISSRTIAVTPLMLKMYLHMGIKAIWAPNCPTKIFYECDISESQREYINIGFVGYLRPTCGIEEMWEAVKFLNRKGKTKYHLLLCGVPMGGFEKVIEKMDKEDYESLDIRPAVHPDKVPQLYREIDIAFQLPRPTPKYKKYGLNVKIYESLATATPVIMAKTSENPEFLKEIGATVLIDDFTPEEIARKVSGLGENPKLRKEMGLKGRAFIKNEFNWEKFSSSYLWVVNQLLNPSQS